MKENSYKRWQKRKKKMRDNLKKEKKNSIKEDNKRKKSKA